MIDLVRANPERGFVAFERLFGSEVRRVTRRHFGQHATHVGQTTDFYHDVLTHLFVDGGRRLLAFDGKGAFSAYLRQVIRNYWLDLVREARGRRRLPEAVQALGPVQQAAFRLMAWEGLSGYEAIEAIRLGPGAGKAEDELQSVIDEIIPHIPPPAPRAAEVAATSLPEPDADVVSALLRWQRVRTPQSELLTRIRRHDVAEALERLREAIAELPDDQRNFLALRYFADTPLPPREIARRWGRPVDQVYEIGRRAMASLRTQIVELGLDGIEL